MQLIPKHPLERLDNFFDDTFPVFKLLPESKFGNSQLAVDIKEKKDCYVIKADFPGMSKDDIQISIDDNVLTIKAEYDESKEDKEDGKFLRQERRYGSYSRSFTLGKNVDEKQIVAEFDKGVLSLKVPKGNVEPASRRIPIK